MYDLASLFIFVVGQHNGAWAGWDGSDDDGVGQHDHSYTFSFRNLILVVSWYFPIENPSVLDYYRSQILSNFIAGLFQLTPFMDCDCECIVRCMTSLLTISSSSPAALSCLDRTWELSLVLPVLKLKHSLSVIIFIRFFFQLSLIMDCDCEWIVRCFASLLAIFVVAIGLIVLLR